MKIQSSIAGYQGNPVTLLAVFEEETGVLVVADQIPFMEQRKSADFAMVSNLDLDGVDYHFSDDNMREAINLFFGMKSQGIVDIVDSVARFDPSNRIERQGMDANGPKYAVSPDVDCGQIGVLAMVLYASKQKSINSAIKAMDEMADFIIRTI